MLRIVLDHDPVHVLDRIDVTGAVGMGMEAMEVAMQHHRHCVVHATTQHLDVAMDYHRLHHPGPAPS